MRDTNYINKDIIASSFRKKTLTEKYIILYFFVNFRKIDV